MGSGRPRDCSKVLGGEDREGQRQLGATLGGRIVGTRDGLDLCLLLKTVMGCVQSSPAPSVVPDASLYLERQLLLGMGSVCFFARSRSSEHSRPAEERADDLGFPHSTPSEQQIGDCKAFYKSQVPF